MSQEHHFEEWAKPIVLPAAILSESERAIAKGLRDSGRLAIIETREGLEVGTTSWVGRVTLGGTSITVRPKIAGTPLVQLLRYAYGLDRLCIIGRATFGAERDAFQDILGQQLAREAAHLIGRGLHREYAAREADLASPRGRLLFDQLLRTLSSARVALPSRYVERTHENVLNAALAAGLRYAAPLMTDRDLGAELRRLSTHVEISAPPFTAGLLSAAIERLDRRTRHYEPAFQLIGLLAEGAGVSLDEQDRPVDLHGFLFDMNRFFQSLVSRLLTDHLANHDVLDEHHLQEMFHYASRAPPRRAPVLKPDFTVRNATRTRLAILDAKYRDLWSAPLPAHMLYQLALYAQGSGNRSAAIVYPSMQPRPEQEVRMRDPNTGELRAHIFLRALDLNDLAQRLAAAGGAKADRHLAEEVRRIAFGGKS